MKKVFKYLISPKNNDVKVLMLPVSAKILHVAMQAHEMFLWALVSSEAETEARFFRVAGTGHVIEYPAGVEIDYIATVMAGPFVWHIFELLNYRMIDHKVENL